MRLKFIKAEETQRNGKATIHHSGKLGFSGDAISSLGLTDQKWISFAINEDNAEDRNLYAVVYDEKTEGAFRINKAGQYYYVGTRAMFDTLGVDYRNSKVIYDIVKSEYEGREIIKFLKRIVRKKEKSLELAL